MLLIGVGIGIVLSALLRSKSGVRAADLSQPPSATAQQAPMPSGGSLTEAEAEAMRGGLDKLDAAALGPVCTVTILRGSGNKIYDIKAIRALTHLDLKDAKDMVDRLPQVMAANVAAAEADRMRKALQAAGMIVRIS